MKKWMLKWALYFSASLILLILAGCGTVSGQIPVTIPPFETPGPLEKSVDYWDMGLRITYPTTWDTPQFGSGQLLVTKALSQLSKQGITQPVVTYGLVDTYGLKIPTDATLRDILERVTNGPDVTMHDSGSVPVAGLDGVYLMLNDSKRNVNGYTIAFRLPDGRVGTFIAIAPTAIWANIVPTFEQMRQKITLIKPADYKVPPAPSINASFPPGGVIFKVPDGWAYLDFQGSRLFFDQKNPTYEDQSGFANGPHLIARVVPFTKGANVLDEMRKTIKGYPSDTYLEVSIDGQQGVEIFSFDPVTSQALNYIAFPSQDGTVMNIFRWTAPGMLNDTLKPTLDAIMQTVKLGPLTPPVLSGSTSAATAKP